MTVALVSEGIVEPFVKSNSSIVENKDNYNVLGMSLWIFMSCLSCLSVCQFLPQESPVFSVINLSSSPSSSSVSERSLSSDTDQFLFIQII